MSKTEILKNVKEILNGIAEECKMLTKSSMTAHGVNDKVGTDTLTSSNLYDSIEVNSTEDGLIEIMVNDYIKYVEGGRTPNKPFPWRLAWGTKDNPGVLVKWASDKGLPTDNTTIYFIWKSIIENGIKPRPIFEIPEGLWASPNNSDDLVFDLTDEYWDDWSEMLFEGLTEELDNYFSD